MPSLKREWDLKKANVSKKANTEKRLGISTHFYGGGGRFDRGSDGPGAGAM